MAYRKLRGQIPRSLVEVKKQAKNGPRQAAQLIFHSLIDKTRTTKRTKRAEFLNLSIKCAVPDFAPGLFVNLSFHLVTYAKRKDLKAYTLSKTQI